MKTFLTLFAAIAVALTFFTSSLDAATSQFRLIVSVKGFTEYNCTGNCSTYQAPAGSQFVILDQSQDSVTVHFKKIGSVSPISRPVKSDSIYVVSSTALKEFTYRGLFGIEHGTLLIPFKLRSRNNTVTNESTLSYYLGYKRNWALFTTTLFASTGLAIIPISDIKSGENENHSGVSYLLGVTLETSDQFQIAFVMGWDHLGGQAGKDWEFEGNPWYSFAVGFRFTGNGS